MTLHKLVSDIRRIASRLGTPSDDSRLNPNQVAEWVRQYRLDYINIATDFGKNTSLLRQFEQPICLDLDCADKSLCSQYKWGEEVKRAIMPDFAHLPDYRAITFAGLIDNLTPFDYSPPSMVSVKRQSRVGDLLSYWTEVGQYVYVFPNSTHEDICVFSMRGVVQDPAAYDDCHIPTYSDSSTKPYPMPSGGAVYVTEQIMTRRLGFAKQMYADTVNNGSDET